VISITDGQIFLESDLFHSGIRPAVNVGLSVSRVGSAAQKKAMSKVAGTLKLDLAQYRELQAFAQFGSDLDKATLARLTRGERLVELLKQGQYASMSLEHQVVSLYAGTRGFLDDVAVEDVLRFEKEIISFFEQEKKNILDHIKTTGQLPDEKEFNAAIEDFKKGFAPSK
jgi:F-type H+-transporting ATPase subunit alpha